MILTSEKQDKLDVLAENLKGLKISKAGYYESYSANLNDKKGDSASDSKLATHTTDGKKRKFTDTSNEDLQQKILSNRNLPIITTMIEPRIGNMVVTSGAYPHKLATTNMMEVIMDAAHSSVRILWTPRRVSRTGRDGTTPGDRDIAVSPPPG